MIQSLENLFLDSKSLQSYCLDGKVTIDDIVRRMSAFRRNDRYNIPDHQIAGECSLISRQYNTLCKLMYGFPYDAAHDFLCEYNHILLVKQEKMEEWLKLSSKISPSIFIAGWYLDRYESENLKSGYFRHFVRDCLQNQFEYTTLLYPHIPDLYNFVQTEKGLFDLHLHLNGSTEMEVIWAKAISNPDKVMAEFDKAYNKESTKKLFEQLMPVLNPDDFKRCLERCGKCRSYLVNAIYELYFPEEKDGSEKVCQGRKHIDHLELLWGDSPERCAYSYIVREILFNILVMSVLRSSKDEWLARFFHFYQITKGLFNALVVQQKNQYGFDQFQAIADNGMREYIEKNYCQRFYQLTGSPTNSFLRQIEGRFSPKETVRDNRNFINKIVSDFDTFKRNSNQSLIELSLIAHFIKRKDKFKDSADIRHKELRINLRKRAEALLTYKKSGDPNSRYLTGIDAAANEMDAAPEVFAPIFNFLRKSNLFHFTYHVGEDYRHLISGMRAIDEAVEFLGMGVGDRLGHCTAIGIDPELWTKRTPEITYLMRGEWLDNLVWVWHLLHSTVELGKFQMLMPLLQTEIMRYSSEIYEAPVSPFDLYHFWELRKYDPLIYLDSSNRYCPECTESYEEWKRITKEFQEGQMAKLYAYYHFNLKSRRKYDEIISVPSKGFFCSELLWTLQNTILKKLMSKNIVIETLPSSNVRISQYDVIDEYHIGRWTDENGQFNPIVVLGTDDPGIFSTNIYNEYSRIYMYWKKKNYSNMAIMKKIEEIHNNSKIFSFHETD